MPASEYIKEYLVSLGMQDNFTEKLGEALEEADEEVSSFAKGFAKHFAIAGTAVFSLIGATSVGIAKFLNHIANAEQEVADYAEEIGKSREEAYRLKTALDAMGVSMEDIEASEELQEQFKILQEDAQKIQIPDMSTGVQQVSDMKVEFLRLKQVGMLALTWIGHYTMKYLHQPLEKAKQLFGSLNDVILKNIPKWSKAMGFFLSSVVRLGLTVIRGAKAIFNAIKKIFDMIPNEIKIITALLAALALFIKVGPIGKLMFIITAVLLLLEDFFVYIDGGEALLGRFWQRLIDIYNTLKDSGAIEKFKQSFVDAMEYIRQGILNIKDFIKDLFKQFQDSGSIEKIQKLFSKLGAILLLIVDILKNVGRAFLDSFGGKGKTFLEWIVSVGLPALLNLLNGVVSVVKGILIVVNKFSSLEGVIKGIGMAFLTWKVGKGLGKEIDNIKKKIESTKEKIISTTERMNKFAKSWEGSKNTPKSVPKEVKGWKEILSEYKEAASKYFVALKQKGVATVKEVTNKGMSIVKGIANKGMSAIKKIAGVGKKAVNTVVKYGVKAGKGAIRAIKSAGTMIAKGVSSAISFFTSPMGLIVLAVAALITIAILVIKNWDKVKAFFIAFGNKVKEVMTTAVDFILQKWNAFKEKFASSNSFFGRVMQAIATIIETYIGIYIDFFKMLWENIKLIFSIIKSLIHGDFEEAYQSVVAIWNNIVAFFKNLISKVVAAIKQVFSPIVNWFQNKVNEIKNKFASIPQHIKQKFTEAVNNIKNVFEPIVSWFEAKVAKIKDTFSGIGEKLSGVKNFVFGGKSENGYAEGGLVTQHQVAEIAEGNQPELIVPLTKKDRAKQLLQKGADYLGISRFQPKQLQKAKGFMEQAANNMAKLQTGLTATTYQTNNQNVSNQYFIDMTSKYTIHDTSGKPQSTARAVDRTVQKRIRNLQGAL